MKNAIEILIRILLSLYINLNSMDILSILVFQSVNAGHFIYLICFDFFNQLCDVFSVIIFHFIWYFHLYYFYVIAVSLSYFISKKSNFFTLLFHFHEEAFLRGIP